MIKVIEIERNLFGHLLAALITFYYFLRKQAQNLLGGKLILDSSAYMNILILHTKTAIKSH